MIGFGPPLVLKPFAITHTPTARCNSAGALNINMSTLVRAAFVDRVDYNEPFF